MCLAACEAHVADLPRSTPDEFASDDGAGGAAEPDGGGRSGVEGREAGAPTTAERLGLGGATSEGGAPPRSSAGDLSHSGGSFDELPVAGDGAGGSAGAAVAMDGSAGTGADAPPLRCEKYFADRLAMNRTLLDVPSVFWADGVADCSIVALFEPFDGSEKVDFLNYLFHWTVLLVGCVPSAEVPGGLTVFPPSRLAGEREATALDRERLIDHYLATLAKHVEFDAADAATIRERVTGSAASLLVSDERGASFDRCAEGALP